MPLRNFDTPETLVEPIAFELFGRVWECSPVFPPAAISAVTDIMRATTDDDRFDAMLVFMAAVVDDHDAWFSTVSRRMAHPPSVEAIGAVVEWLAGLYEALAKDATTPPSATPAGRPVSEIASLVARSGGEIASD